ncbi:acyl-CoA dehydratase activase [Chloroflexota bacterium]
MIVAGIDIGSSSAKAVIMEESKVISSSIIPTGPSSAETARQVMEKALTNGLSLKDVEYIVSTGYGRVNVPFAQKNITEISCHARGIVEVFPDVRTILDMGGQDCKAIRINEKGNVLKFLMNEKCAAGTGRYLERIAVTLSIPLDDIGSLSLQSETPAEISSYCTVFAEGDAITLLRQGTPVNDILAGVCESLADRTQILIKRLGLVEDFSICGGIAKNIGIVKRLERNLGVEANIAPEPQIIGALGAALFAHSFAAKSSSNL